MEKTQVLELLERIKVCLDKNVDIAKDLVELEIDNLKGETEKRCKNTRYYFANSGCKDCSNLNCKSNKKNTFSNWMTEIKKVKQCQINKKETHQVK